MNWLRAHLTRTPLVARVVPFVIFVVLTFTQEWFGPAGRYWIYLAKTLLGAAMLVAVWPAVEEMRWAWSWEALAVGVGLFVLWAGLDDLFVSLGWKGSYPKLNFGAGAPWNPHAHFGQGALWAWFFVVVRLAGSTLVVPPLEEVFFRSFVYRYISKADFLSVPLGAFAARPFFITSLLFAAEHREWLAGLICGLAFQWLVWRKQRLGDAMTAHAITNLLLGLWVVWRGEWRFW
jgi:CAAX prenyl protease-like protein